MPENSCCHQGTIHTIDFVSVTFLEVKYTLYSVHVLYYDICSMVFFLFADSEQSTLSIPMDKTTVFYIAVGVACSIILIIALAVAAIHVHSMPSPNKESRLVCKDQSILTNRHNISLNVHLPLLITVLIRLQAELGYKPRPQTSYGKNQLD